MLENLNKELDKKAKAGEELAGKYKTGLDQANKSLTELEDLVDNKGLTFGMNVSKYKLDKD